MFCTNCGNKLEDDALFCTSCGTKVEAEATVEEAKEEPVKEEPVEEVKEEPVKEAPVEEVAPAEEVPAVPANIPYKAESEKVKPQRTIGQELKRFVISPLVIVAVLCFTAFIVTSIMEAGNIVTDTFDKIIEGFSDTASPYYVEDFEDDFNEYFNEIFGVATDAINDIFKVSMIIVLLPDIIACACLWITVLSAFDKKALSVTTSGITTIKVMNMIGIIFASIISLLSLVDIVFGIIGLITDSYLFAVATIFIAVIMLPVYALRLYYKIKLNSTINSFTHTAKRNTVVNKASKFVAVVLMICGVFQALLGLLSTSTVSMWLGAISTICFSIIVFKYRNLCEYMINENTKQ